MELKRILPAILLGCILLGGTLSPAQAQAGGTPPDILQQFQRMTPEQRVGQLFLVTFQGTDTSDKSQIYDLIANHYIGGVVLLAANDNFQAPPNTVQAAYQLTGSLQQIEWDSATTQGVDPESLRPLSHAYVPLFIATAQDGDGPPGDQIINGLTPLPSEMSIGAAWSS